MSCVAVELTESVFHMFSHCHADTEACDKTWRDGLTVGSNRATGVCSGDAEVSQAASRPEAQPAAVA